ELGSRRLELRVGPPGRLRAGDRPRGLASRLGRELERLAAAGRRLDLEPVGGLPAEHHQRGPVRAGDRLGALARRRYRDLTGRGYQVFDWRCSQTCPPIARARTTTSAAPMMGRGSLGPWAVPRPGVGDGEGPRTV